MTQEEVDRIENQKFLTAQRHAQEKAEREAKLAIADSVFESEEELTGAPAEDLTPVVDSIADIEPPVVPAE